MCDSWEPVKAVCGPTGRPSTLYTTAGPQSPTPAQTAVWQNFSKPPKTSLCSQKVWPRQVCGHWTGDGSGTPATIVSRKKLSADDPACTVVVLQSHPYESGSDMRRVKLCSSQTNRALHRHILQSGARTPGREREGGESTFCSAAAVCVLSSSVSPPLVTGPQTKLLLELLRISTKSCDNENGRNGHLLKRIKSFGV